MSPMLLADAIEAWGDRHRRELTEAELIELGAIWRKVRESPVARFDVESMTKDDARAVMALFDAADRPAVSRRLNSVRSWTMARAAGPSVVPESPSSPRRGDVGAGGDDRPARIVEVGAKPPPVPTRVAPRGPVEPLHPTQPLTEKPPPPPAKVFGLIALVAVVLIGGYFLFLRGDDSSDLTTGGDDASIDFGDSGSDFCAVARQLTENDPLADISFTDGKVFFDRSIELWSGLAAIAPPEIAADVLAMQQTLSAMQTVAEQYDYNMVDPAFATALAAIDTTAMDTAGANVDTYLTQVCGISIDGSTTDTGADSGTDSGDDGSTGTGADSGTDGGESTESTGSDVQSFSSPDAEAVSLALFESLGITPELAECLNRELGDFDNASADATLLSKEVCGTTLYEVLANLSG